MKSSLLTGALAFAASAAPPIFAADADSAVSLARAASTLAEKTQSLPSAVGGVLSGGNLPLLFALLAVVPALLIATTCYVRVITVLSLLRQAIGLAQIPSAQILAVLSLFLTLLVMSPTWTRVYREAWIPYAQNEIDLHEAVRRGETPVRSFLWKQIERSRNTGQIALFLRSIPDAEMPEYYEDLPWRALLPAFILSELKTAFFIGLQLFLPFVIIDLVVSGVMVSMGMMMLPPTVVSLPFKLMLFVLLDAWDPVVQMLIDSLSLV
ncbi:MAG: flagellar type III secretion system pore protein FliP [Thermoguttaceae bacterium]|nr:flagellar type III secretion system pore protein FliP [Thermoguttaceae bacterium]